MGIGSLLWRPALLCALLLLCTTAAKADECGFGSDFVACDQKAKCDTVCERSTCRWEGCEHRVLPARNSRGNPVGGRGATRRHRTRMLPPPARVLGQNTVGRPRRSWQLRLKRWRKSTAAAILRAGILLWRARQPTAWSEAGRQRAPSLAALAHRPQLAAPSSPQLTAPRRGMAQARSALNTARQRRSSAERHCPATPCAGPW
jgi:hypothetical protein